MHIIDRFLVRVVLLAWSFWSVASFASGGQADTDERGGEGFHHTTDKQFPTTDYVTNVTRPPYNAKGDGKADDTAAIQKALSDVMGGRQPSKECNRALCLFRGRQVNRHSQDWSSSI